MHSCVAIMHCHESLEKHNLASLCHLGQASFHHNPKQLHNHEIHAGLHVRPLNADCSNQKKYFKNDIKTPKDKRTDQRVIFREK